MTKQQQKGRAAAPPITDHRAALRERLGRAAYESARENPMAVPSRPWAALSPAEQANWHAIGQAVLAQLTTAGNRRGEIEVASVMSHQDGEPMVDLWVSLSPAQLSPGKARELALMLLEAADAAESDAALSAFARSQLGLDTVQVAGLVGQVRALRERRRGKAVDSA